MVVPMNRGRRAGLVGQLLACCLPFSSCATHTAGAFSSAEEFSHSVKIDKDHGRVSAYCRPMFASRVDGDAGMVWFRYHEDQSATGTYILGIGLRSPGRLDLVTAGPGAASDCTVVVTRRHRARSGLWVTLVELGCSESEFAEIWIDDVVLAAPEKQWTVKIPRRLVDGFLQAVAQARLEGAS